MDENSLYDALQDVLDDIPIEGDSGFLEPVSADAITHKTVDLAKLQSVAEQYSKLQHVHLTSIQFQILNAITSKKIQDATLKDLVSAYKVLKDKELVSQGKPAEITGLVAYLVAIENGEDEEILRKSEMVNVTPCNGEEDTEDKSRKNVCAGVPQL